MRRKHHLELELEITEQKHGHELWMETLELKDQKEVME